MSESFLTLTVNSATHHQKRRMIASLHCLSLEGDRLDQYRDKIEPRVDCSDRAKGCLIQQVDQTVKGAGGDLA